MKATIPIWMHKIQYKAPERARSPLDIVTLDDNFEVAVSKAEVQLIYTYSASSRESKGSGWFYGISSERQGDKDLYPGILVQHNAA